MGREAATVVVTDVNAANAAAVRDEIVEAGGRAIARQLDVADEQAVQTTIAAVLAALGRLDILVNNAGIYPATTVEDMAEAEWDRVIGTNLTGTFLCSRAVAPHLLAQRSGRIISLASGRAIQGARNGAHYAATKAGIIGFSRSLALELSPSGITVNVILPGVTDTAQPRGHMTEEDMYAQARAIPLGRIGQPDDLVGPAIFLASDAAGFITGQTIVVNGGFIMA
jgi:3-oxoacyl-[acyl-carrier protein] reductase